MSYDTMTLLDLKKMCKDRGLKVSGNKDEVIIRLMEADEAINPTYQSTTFSTPVNSMPGQIPVSPQVVYGRMTPQGIVVSRSNGTVSAVGSIIILYGIFRMFWALAFAAIGDGGLGWLLAPVAFIVASLFIFSGILMTQEYRNGVNITKLESYIHPQGFDVAQFYIDFEGHPDDHSVKLALEEMKFFCKEIKVLGVYKKSDFRKK